jgi:Resolvase, N terminal domain
MSGAVKDRPALHDALEFARSGGTLIVWKLDRLARSKGGVPMSPKRLPGKIIRFSRDSWESRIGRKMGD